MTLEFVTQVGQGNMTGRQAPVAGGLGQHRRVPVQLPGAAVAAAPALEEDPYPGNNDSVVTAAAAAPALEEGLSPGENNDGVATAVGLRAGSACTPAGGW